MTTDETIKEDVSSAVSEPENVELQETQEENKVPVSALQAERERRQKAEAQARLYEEYLAKLQAEQKQEESSEEDPSALLEKGEYQKDKERIKREILEQVYQDLNPEAVRKVDKYLKPILEKKPWLAATLDSAPNRYARAYEIVQDYLHIVEPKSKVLNEGQRIIENSKKPGSPVALGKSAQPSGVDLLKSMQGKKEFREYRQKLLRGEL